jgi:long-chain fatty acid transport protein
MKARMPAILTAALLFTLPPLGFAGGFYNNQHDAKAIGMGGAGVAVVDNPSAVCFNPAGMGQLEGFQFRAGASVFDIHSKFNGDSGEEVNLEGDPIWIPHAYVTYRATPKLSFGVGTFTDFGLGTDWEDDWSGRFIIGGTFAQMKTNTINPAVAYQIQDQMTIAAGVVAKYMSVDIRNMMPNLLGGFGIGPSPAAVPETEVKLAGNDWAYGYNLGIMATFADSWRFGAAYRSQIRHSIDGRFSMEDDGVNGYSDTDFSADITLPAYANVGLAWISGPWTITGEMLWIQWSSYDKLEAEFARPQGVAGINQVDKITSKKDWRDTFTWILGLQYQINTNWALRGGFIYDPSPIPDETVDPVVPSGLRIDYSLGLGYKIGAFSVDAAYLLVTDKGRRFDNNVGDLTAIGQGQVSGDFDNVYVNIFALSLSYQF